MPALTTIIGFGFDLDPPSVLAAYKRLGCTAVQFYRNRENPPTLGHALAVAASVGLPYDSMHGVFGEDLDPSSPDPAHRAACLRTYEEEGRLALDLGGPRVVVHPSRVIPQQSRPGRAELKAQQATRWGDLADFLSRLAEVGARLGVAYLIENQPLNCPLGHDPVRLAAAVREAGSPNIRMCFDTGHAHIVGDVAAVVGACAGEIAYFHIHDNDSTEDDHRIPGRGTIDWTGPGGFGDTLRRARVDGPRMLELFLTAEQIDALAADGFRGYLDKALAL